MKIDFRGVTFDEFIRLVFDQPLGKEHHEWFYSIETDYTDEELDSGEVDDIALDPAVQVAHLTRLFAGPRESLSHLTRAQINAGFWFLACAENDSFLQQLWNPTVPRADRLACARHIPTLYSALFLPLELDELTWMFGDFAVKDIYDFGSTERFQPTDVDGMRDVFLDVFDDVLHIPDPRAWHGALHGLGHLRHPRGAELIRRFLTSQPALPSELRDYAERTLAGERIL